MTLTDGTRTDTIYQVTQRAMRIPWGRFSRYLDLSKRLRTAVALQRQKDATPGGDLVLEFGLASLAGYGSCRISICGHIRGPRIRPFKMSGCLVQALHDSQSFLAYAG